MNRPKTVEEWREFNKRSNKMPHTKISKGDFIALLIENGMAADEAERQATISECLNSYIEIGDIMVGVENPSKTEA